MRESNSRQRFWRPLSYHLTNPLYCNSLLSAYYLYHISSIYVNRIFHFFYFFAKFLFFRIYRTSHWQLLSYKYIAKEDLSALFLEPGGLLSSIHLLSQHFQYSFFEIHQVILFRLPEPKLLLQSPLEFRML